MKIAVPNDRKVEVLQALYVEAFVAPAAIMFGSAGPAQLSQERAEAYVAQGYIDYCDGRGIKIDFSKDELDTRLYDRDAGEGRGEAIIRRVLGQ